MREPMQCLENIIPNLDVPDFQNIGLQESLFNKKMLLAFDTGTGKTYTYALIVRSLINRNPDKKHIFVIIHDSMEQAPRDIADLVEVPVEVFSSVEGEFGHLRSVWDTASILIMTYECFRRQDMMLFLFQHQGEVESLVIDEAHHVANWDSSDTAFMIRSFAHYIPYVIALSATPVTTEKRQHYHLMNLIDRSLSPRRDETPQGKYLERYMSVNRSDYNIKGNYKTTLEVIQPQVNQLGDVHGIVSKKIKGYGAVHQVDALVRVVQERLRQGKNVIVYVNLHETRKWVEEHFIAANIKFVSLHGKITKQEERQGILRKYNDGEVNVLITSISESLNINSDVIVFYEFTTKLKQVMGRAHRGLAGKELELVFMITKDTMEVDYFMKYVYKRSIMIQKLLQKDYSEFIEVGERIKALDLFASNN